MNVAQQNAIQKTILVEVAQVHAFRVFTEQHGAWWPFKTHHIGKVPAETAVIEPRLGGRWFERAHDGSECNWGKFWSGTRRFDWCSPGKIGADWQYDPGIQTEVEVRFISEGDRKTRVEFEHRNLDEYGAQANSLREMMDAGWTMILQLFVDAAEQSC